MPVLRGRAVASFLAVLAISGLVITLTRFPTFWPDANLYASVARSWQLHGIGVPSGLWFSPSAVDHTPFYGPVYFEIVARSFDVFGVTRFAARIVSLSGAVLAAAAAAWLARTFNPEGDRPWWAFALVLLTPEVGAIATGGAMQPLAVGFELLALALFVRGIVTRRRPLAHGLAAGAALTAAALTTPRSYPFVVALLASGAALGVFWRPHRRFIAIQTAASGVVLSIGLAWWSVASLGSLSRWAAYMAFILSREDADVMAVSTAVRIWAFSGTSAITPVFALAAGAAAAAASIGRTRRELPQAAAAAFALSTSIVAGVVTFLGMNFTFGYAMYFAFPLFAVVVSLPAGYFQVPRRVIATAVFVLLAADSSAAALKYARIAATWDARDPAAMTDFIRARVPPNAAIVAPTGLYFFSIEGGGSQYRTASSVSAADWTRWVPQFDPSAVKATEGLDVPDASGRFLLWPSARELPSPYECARPALLGEYKAPSHRLAWLGRFGNVWDKGLPDASLYRLPDGCPSGYDPTGPS